MKRLLIWTSINELSSKIPFVQEQDGWDIRTNLFLKKIAPLQNKCSPMVWSFWLNNFWFITFIHLFSGCTPWDVSRSEDDLRKSGFSFHSVGPRYLIQLIRPGGKHLRINLRTSQIAFKDIFLLCGTWVPINHKWNLDPQSLRSNQQWYKLCIWGIPLNAKKFFASSDEGRNKADDPQVLSLLVFWCQVLETTT